MRVLVYVIVLLCALAMFFVRREYKAGILLFTLMCFSSVSLDFLPFMKASICLMSIMLIVSEIRHIGQCMRQLKKTVIWKVLTCIVFLTALTIMNSPHLRTFTEIYRFVLSELFLKYFMLAYAFWSFSQSKSLRPTLRLSLIGLVVLTVLGIVNYYTKSADFVVMMNPGKTVVIGDNEVQLGTVYVNRDRFRVSSTFVNPFDYGYMCVLCLIVHLYGYVKRHESKLSFGLALACCLFGILFCECRTVHFCLLLCVGTFILAAFRIRRIFTISILAVLIGFICYMYVPIVQEKADSMITMFDKKSQFGGSSIEMRTLQYVATLEHVKDSPFLGNGYRYFYIDMGWKDGMKGLRDDRFWGLEGVMMGYVLERGFIGLALWIFIYSSLMVYCIRSRKYNRELAALGIAVLLTYLAFSNMTGELSSVAPTLLFVGFVIKALENEKLRITPPPLGN